MREPTAMVCEAREVAAARSAVYRCLSGSFFYPPLGRGQWQGLADTLRGRLAVLPHDRSVLEPLLAELAAQSIPPVAVLGDTFTALFDNCTGRAAVSLYEKEYGNGDAKVIWEEVIRFYEHFGLEFDVGVSRDWPDHVGTELEFMHYLTYLEAVTDDAGEVCRRAQGDFLARHLARWIRRFAARVDDASGNAPYGVVARLAAAFVDADLGHLGRLPEPDIPLIPQREAQAGIRGKSWIPIRAMSR